MFSYTPRVGRDFNSFTKVPFRKVLASLIMMGTGCSKPTPPPVETRTQAPVESVAHPGPLGSATATTSTGHSKDDTGQVSVATEESTTSQEVEIQAVPPLVDPNGNSLPQTNDRPEFDSPSFERRLALLVEAIANDQPETALPAFFPRVAYAQVKAIKDPDRDWERRLVAAFKRNVHEYHKKLPPTTKALKFVRLDAPEAKVKWIEPGVEGNRLGYFRVTRSKLLLQDESGKELSFELTSLISWRGEWYVVHLHGFE